MSDKTRSHKKRLNAFQLCPPADEPEKTFETSNPYYTNHLDCTQLATSKPHWCCKPGSGWLFVTRDDCTSRGGTVRDDQMPGGPFKCEKIKEDDGYCCFRTTGECVFCMGPLRRDQGVNPWQDPLVGKCHHYVHKKCLRNWRKNCPLCETPPKPGAFEALGITYESRQQYYVPEVAGNNTIQRDDEDLPVIDEDENEQDGTTTLLCTLCGEEPDLICEQCHEFFCGSHNRLASYYSLTSVLCNSCAQLEARALLEARVHVPSSEFT